MTAAASVPPLLWLLVCLATAGGAWLLWAGVRGRRIGDVPFCDRCGHSVAGVCSGVCPECGTDLTRPNGVLVGQLVPSARRAVLGIMIILLAWAVLSAAQSELLGNGDPKAVASVPTFIWLLVGLALAGGGWLVWKGARGRRVGDAPSCGRCGYSVAGISSDVCPECGTDLTRPDGVHFGKLVRKPGLAVLGVVTILLASLALSAARSQRLRNYDWYVHAPTRWVLDDLAGPPTPQRLRAWKELNRRIRLKGPLSKEDHDRLATIALLEQVRSSRDLIGGHTVTRGLLDWLEDESVHDRLIAAQRFSFLENALVTSLTMPPLVQAGTPVQFQIPLDSAGGGMEYGRFSRADVLSVSLDGESPKVLERSAAGAGLGYGSLIVSHITLDTPGKHDLAFTLHVQVLNLQSNTRGVGQGAPVEHEYELTLKTKVEVVSADRR